MNRFIHARQKAHLVLAWFVLSLGLAVVSPLFSPAAQIVCSSSGSHWVPAHGDEGQAGKHAFHTLDCPLCVVSIAPPPVLSVSASGTVVLPYALPIYAPVLLVHIASGLPLARAPPSSL